MRPTAIITPTPLRRCATVIGSTSRSPARPSLIDWDLLGDALPEKPVWARTTQDFWAPSVIFDGSTYFMYYSATPDICERMARPRLAIATSKYPDGPFEDMGQPLLLGTGFEFIDPMAFDDPVTGKHLLYWGSGFQPIRVQELGADRMRLPGAACRSISSGPTARMAASRGWSKPHG